jgi:ELWxxDGT repeat protein
MFRLGQLDGNFLYLRRDPEIAWEIWRSNGDVKGTQQLSTLGISAFRYPENFYFKANASTAVFSNYNKATQTAEIWRIEKGAASASLLYSLKNSDPINNLLLSGNQVFFSIRVDRQFFVNRLDLVSKKIEEVGKFGNYLGLNSALAAYKSGIVFPAGPQNGTGNSGLYYYDASSAKLQRIADLPAMDFFVPEVMISGDRIFFFLQNDADGKYYLYTSDGTAAGTKALIELKARSFLDPSMISERTIFLHKGKLYFAGKPVGASAQGRDELYVSDGTTAGTKTLRFSSQEPLSARNFVAYKDQLIFTGFVGAFNTATLKINDATGLLSTLLDGTGLGSGISFGAGSTVVYQDSLVFGAGRDRFGWEPWISDGTPKNTRCLDLQKGIDGSEVSDFEAVGDKLFFSATTRATGYEIFVLNRSKTTPIREAPAQISMKVYPNPTQHEAWLEAPDRVEEWKVFDASGRLWTSGKEGQGNTLRLNLEHFPPGTYFVQALSGGKLCRGTFLKKE